jgi:hypothetical protein
LDTATDQADPNPLNTDFNPGVSSRKHATGPWGQSPRSQRLVRSILDSLKCRLFTPEPRDEIPKIVLGFPEDVVQLVSKCSHGLFGL